MINTLISKKSCKVAPVPGETKIWQYVSLFKRVSLIDCPGVVVNTAGDTEEDSVLKGVVRSERLENPEDYIDAILERVKREYVFAQYKIPKDVTWENTLEFLEIVARRFGRLVKGGEPCIRSAAIMIINDYQRGRLPHYVAPPELKEEEAEPAATATIDKVTLMKQDMDQVGIAKKEKSEKSKEPEEDVVSDDEEAEEDSGDSKRKASETKSDTHAAASLIGEGDWED